MDISLVVAIAGLIVSPASAFIAIRVQTEVLKVQLANVSRLVERLDKDTRETNRDNQLQERELIKLVERVSVLEREVKRLKEK